MMAAMQRLRTRSRAPLALLAGALALFHLWLLWSRIAGGAWDAVAAARWLGATLLLGAWFAVKRRGRVRKGHVLVWAALVLLLHAAGGPAAEAQVSCALVVSAWLLRSRSRPAFGAPLRLVGFAVPAPETLIPAAPGQEPFAARPPPFAFAR
jgi:hypothetical protein